MSVRKAYRQRAFKRSLTAFFLVVLGFVFLWLNLISGSNGVMLSDTFKLFEWGNQLGMIVEAIRLPRALGAILVGMLLGLSGVAMQGVLRNPLASPFTLGISQAASFGASFAIIMLEPTIATHPFISKFSVALSAFGTSMLCAICIIWIGKKVGMSPTSLILAGVGLGSLFHSGTMFLQYFTTEINAAATLFWTFGDLSKATYPILWFLLVTFCLALGVLWTAHWKFDALGFGDESAFNKGVNVKNFRILMLLFSSLCTAVAVAFFGMIGFIGLVAPHLVRLAIGSSHSALIPLSALSGGVLLLGADWCARMLLYPSSLPVGILTSFIGAPMLLYLLVFGGKIK
ncbi:MAG: iron ABC transporter permease [Sulfurospirillaceae bacterium]|nr:iron ABC transporter permease [Sulfurospirillaceae bacterium]